MEWHVNDLSIAGQFATPHAFKAALEPLLQLRSREQNLRDRLYCSRSLVSRPVTPNANLQQAVLAIGDKSFCQLTLAWMSKGPFWDDSRLFHEDDYFEYDGHDVTNQGLGEAARRRQVEIPANTFSFGGSPHCFASTPLCIQHGLPEDIIGTVDVDNWWDLATLEATLKSLRTVRSWADLQIEVTSRFPNLTMSARAFDKLLPTPFSTCVTTGVFERLMVLDTIVQETSTAGKLSILGMALLESHFSGGKAWFSDESTTNKISFRQEMTFKDPADDGKTLFCPWHGKIKTPQTRIHFEWPRPANQREIKVLYIGPKITKD
jgi:hypothetical protein